jgi:hypothetical protein
MSLRDVQVSVHSSMCYKNWDKQDFSITYPSIFAHTSVIICFRLFLSPILLKTNKTQNHSFNLFQKK